MDAGREARFRIELFTKLLYSTRSGVNVNTILELQLKLMQNKFLAFVEPRESPTLRKHKSRSFVYAESFIWYAATLAVAIGITAFLIVTQPSLSTVSDSVNFLDIKHNNRLQFGCLDGDWSALAVSRGTEAYLTSTDSPYLPLVYVVSDIYGTEYPMTVVGFGEGLGLWGDSANELWRQTRPQIRLQCSLSACYAYSGNI
jgi:hypothetical protein